MAHVTGDAERHHVPDVLSVESQSFDLIPVRNNSPASGQADPQLQVISSSFAVGYDSCCLPAGRLRFSGIVESSTGGHGVAAYCFHVTGLLAAAGHP